MVVPSAAARRSGPLNVMSKLGSLAIRCSWSKKCAPNRISDGTPITSECDRRAPRRAGAGAASRCSTNGSARPSVNLTAAAATAAPAPRASRPRNASANAAEHQQRRQEVVVSAAHGVEQQHRIESDEDCRAAGFSPRPRATSAARNVIATAAAPAMALYVHSATTGGTANQAARSAR